MTHAPQLIDIDRLDAHPLNPRPVITEDDVSDLVSMMGDTYSSSHPIRVRQIGERYQIIGGHRRTAAARIKGHSRIWCNVEILGKEKAFMELVRDNSQKELDPIYVGIHAHLACDVAEDGKGLKGGISEYARQIGRDRGAVSRLRAAGEVAKKACHVTRLPDGISRQLYEISRMPEPCWKEACDWMIGLTADQRRDGMGTVRDVNSRVSSAMSLELADSTMGTGNEIAARLEVFHGAETEIATPNAIDPPTDIVQSQAEAESAAITACETTAIEASPQTHHNVVSAEPDSVDTFDDDSHVTVSTGLQRDDTTAIECSVDSHDVTNGSTHAYYDEREDAITRDEALEFLTHTDIMEFSAVVSDAFSKRDQCIRHNVTMGLSREMSEIECHQMIEFAELQLSHIASTAE